MDCTNDRNNEQSLLDPFFLRFRGLGSWGWRKNLENDRWGSYLDLTIERWYRLAPVCLRSRHANRRDCRTEYDIENNEQWGKLDQAGASDVRLLTQIGRA